MGKILVINGEKVTPLNKIKFTEEGKLQDYLEKYPSLIPLSEILEGAPDLLCIGREVPAGQGWVDLLFVDIDGLLTIVETKLEKNPESRRKVIGQVIEYASYISKWTADDVYRIANAYLKANLDTVLAARCQGDFSVDNFRPNIEQNLKTGRMRLIIAVDELIEPLRAMVTFLNSYSNFDILLLQVSSFESETKKVLIPLLFGYTPQVAERNPQKRDWDEEKFFADVKKRHQPVEIISELYEFTKKNSDDLKNLWGKGTTVGSFTFRKLRYGILLSIFTVQSDGLWYPHFGAWRSTGVDESAIKSFREKLNEIPGINIPEDAKFPYMPIKALAEEKNLRSFEEAVLALCRRFESREK